jgi:predicted DsbA family dithiol-disulfide isomerase
MKVDIWSDVRCPFCYIGKRKFELALAEFEHTDEIEIEWHSFELDPMAVTLPEANPIDHLAQIKGQSREWALEMTNHVAKVASEVGLQFNMEKAVVANSFNAHRLIQLAKANDLGNEIEERLFKDYFISGKNIDDKEVLIAAGMEVGLDRLAIEMMLESESFTDEVRMDEAMARQIGISGVPFFIFNKNLAVSGAQAPDTFLGAMEQAYSSFASS